MQADILARVDMSRRNHYPRQHRNRSSRNRPDFPSANAGAGCLSLVVILIVISYWQTILTILICGGILVLLGYLGFRYRREIAYLLGRFFRWLWHGVTSFIQWCREKRTPDPDE